MPAVRKQIHLYATEEEKAHIEGLAAQTGLSSSQLLLRLVMGYRMPRPEDFTAWRAIRDLLKVNADLARLGNLFKLAVDERPDQVAEFERLGRQIAETQTSLKECVALIRGQLQPKRR